MNTKNRVLVWEVEKRCSRRGKSFSTSSLTEALTKAGCVVLEHPSLHFLVLVQCPISDECNPAKERDRITSVMKAVNPRIIRVFRGVFDHEPVPGKDWPLYVDRSGDKPVPHYLED